MMAAKVALAKGAYTSVPRTFSYLPPMARSSSTTKDASSVGRVPLLVLLM